MRQCLPLEGLAYSAASLQRLTHCPHSLCMDVFALVKGHCRCSAWAGYTHAKLLISRWVPQVRCSALQAALDCTACQSNPCALYSFPCYDRCGGCWRWHVMLPLVALLRHHPSARGRGPFETDISSTCGLHALSTSWCDCSSGNCLGCRITTCVLANIGWPWLQAVGTAVGTAGESIALLAVNTAGGSRWHYACWLVNPPG